MKNPPTGRYYYNYFYKRLEMLYGLCIKNRQK